MTDERPATGGPAVSSDRIASWSSGLRARLFGLGLVVALPLVALSGYRLWEHKQQGDVAVRQNVLHATELVAERVERRVQVSNAMLDVIGASIHFDPRYRAHNDSLLRGALHTSAAYTNFYAYDREGRLVGAARYQPSLDSLQGQLRRLGVLLRSAPTLYIGVRNRSRVLPDSAYVVLFARGVYDGAAMVGGVALTVRVDSIGQTVDLDRIAPGAVVTLFDTSGTILARSVNGVTTVPDSGAMQDPAVMALPPGVRMFDGTPGSEKRIMGNARTAHAPWHITVSVPEAAASAPVHAELARDLLVALLAAASALWLAYFAGGRIVRPLNVLAADARTIASGVVGHRSRIRDVTEIGVLANAFNQMADTVEGRSAALADSERRYRLLFDSNPLPMWAWDADTMEILAVNEAAIDHYGYDRDTFLSLRIIDLIDEGDHERFGRARLPFSESRQNAGIWTHRTADGRQLEMEVVTTSSRRLGRASWLSVGIDITARREAERALARSEEQLRQSQKMEAIGAFAGGIAHDFNNLLTGMLGYCDLALIDLEEDSPVRREIDELRKLALRGADLTRQILAVSRKQVVQPTVFEPNAVVRGLDRLLARLIGEHINLRTELDNQCGRIRADIGQLEQVLLNLAANARDAMPSGGTLIIRTHGVSRDEAQAQGLATNGSWVAISVQDNGSGMTDEVKQRIFEPFFTTKERGKGTGLGLALAYGVVEQSGGVISVESAPGEGSTFTLYFPAVQDAVVAPLSGEHFSRNLHGTETILLAEDEEAVRSVASSTLQRWGYNVLTAADGSTALAIARSYPGEIDLLLTDVVMPGMNGRELAEALVVSRPGTRVLFASGYTDDAALLKGIRLDDFPFVQKPFTPLELAQRVREALGEAVRVR